MSDTVRLPSRFVQTWTEFAALEDEWDALLAESSVGCTFLTWDWVSSWAAVYGGEVEPLVHVCRDERGALTGIVPLARRTTLGSKLVRPFSIAGNPSVDQSRYRRLSSGRAGSCRSGAGSPASPAGAAGTVGCG